MCKLREKLCKLFLPKDSKIVKKDAIILEELENNNEQKEVVDNAPTELNKKSLEDILKQFSDLEQSVVVEGDGNLSFVNAEGKTKKVQVPLLSIVRIPQIPVNSVDLDKYYKDNFGGTKGKKEIKDITELLINMPSINITPTYFPSQNKIKIEK